MPPSLDIPSLHILLLPEVLSLFKLGPQDELPTFVVHQLSRPTSNQFLSVTRTSEETSVIVTQSSLPDGAGSHEATSWRGFRLKGPLDFGLVGIMNDLTTPLKRTKIPVFVISTWDTDYLLVPEDKFEGARAALRDDGWTLLEDA